MRKQLSAGAGAVLLSFAGAALAQTATPLNVGGFKPDGTNLASWSVNWLWNSDTSTWGLQPADSGYRPFVNIYSMPNVSLTGSLPGFATTPAFTISGSLPGFATTPAFTISGSLPAFATTPAFTISGSLPGFATTPAFTISGSLPGFATTPAFTVAGTLPAFAATPGVKQQDSAGGDATDTTNHAVRVNCVTGCGGGGGGAVTQGAGSSSNGWFVRDQDSSGADATDPTNHAVKVNAPLAYNLVNPSVSYTVVATTGGTAYAAGALLCSSTTAATCSSGLPSFSLPLSGGRITGYHIRISDSTTTAWSQGSQLQIKEWSAQPTLAAGDHAAYALTSGTANWLGDFLCTMNGEEGDGATGYCLPIGPVPELKGVNSVYVALLTPSGSGVTTASGFTVTLVPSIEQ